MFEVPFSECQLGFQLVLSAIEHSWTICASWYFNLFCLQLNNHGQYNQRTLPLLGLILYVGNKILVLQRSLSRYLQVVADSWRGTPDKWIPALVDSFFGGCGDSDQLSGTPTPMASAYQGSVAKLWVHLLESGLSHLLKTHSGRCTLGAVPAINGCGSPPFFSFPMDLGRF